MQRFTNSFVLLSSSHIPCTPVGFFSSLKVLWGKAFENYKFSNPGIPLTKYTFAAVFKSAWIDCVKKSTITNSFKESGICPFNPGVINHERLAPSLPMSSEASVSSKSSASNSLCQELEHVMRPETVKLYHTRYEEKYDIDDDELYSVWEKLHRMTISDKSDKPVVQPKKVECIPKKQQVVSAALTYPESKHIVAQTKGNQHHKCRSIYIERSIY